MYAKPWDRQKTTFYGLTELEAQILVFFIQQNRGHWMSGTAIRVRLMEFVFSGQSLVALYNFLIWSLLQDWQPVQIIEIIESDLNNMHERSFEARTRSYEQMEEHHAINR